TGVQTGALPISTNYIFTKEKIMYVVAGVTGQTGRAVAQALLEQGKPVTVIVRTEEKGRAWRSKGAKVAVAALEDAAVLQGVLAGTEGAYLLVPPNYGAG